MFREYFNAQVATWMKRLLFASILALGGCAGNTVVITYRALINADKVVGGPPDIAQYNPGEVSGKVILVYCISEIVNTRPNAADFVFNVENLYATANGSEILFANKNSWSWTATGVVVGKGQTLSNIGRILIRAPRSKDENASPTSFSLFYSSGANESVLMTREPATDPSYLGALGPLDMGQFLDQHNISICQNTKQ